MVGKTEKINILAVDDHASNLLVLEQYLKGPEINVIRAESGNEALGLILEHPIALILMDVQMPEMDGFETADIIRQNIDSREIPIIFLTAFSKDDLHVYKGYRSGAVDYMIKPFDPDILKSKVDVFIRLYRQKQALESVNLELEQRVEQRTKELRKAKEKAEQANIAKSKFLSNITHELLTPLHHIISFAALGVSISQDLEPEKLHRYFCRVAESGERLQTLLQNLLMLSQFQSGTVRFIMQEHNIINIVRAALDSYSVLIREKSIRVKLDQTQVDSVIVCDNEKLIILFGHLFSNAVQYSAPGETIEVSFASVPLVISTGTFPALLISIRDYGIGIPVDELTQIFGLFNESSFTESKAGGKGLGLTLCWEIVAAHHGRIWAENNADKGAVFMIHLPYQQPNVD